MPASLKTLKQVRRCRISSGNFHTIKEMYFVMLIDLHISSDIMMNTICLVLTFLICTEEKSNCLDRDSLEPFKTSLKSAMVETGLQNCVINCKCAPDLNIKCEIMVNFNTMQFMIIIILALLRYYNNLGSINLLKVSSQLPRAAST